MTVRVLLDPPPPTPSPRRAAGVLSRARWVFLLVGIVALGYSGWAYIEAEVYQAYEDWSFDQEVAGRRPSVGAFLRDQVAVRPVSSDTTPRAEADATAGSESVASARQIAPREEHRIAEKRGVTRHDPSLIGRVAIPRLKVRAVVKEGVDERTLRRAVGHVPETVRPGVPGNVGLAGHRDTFFRRLKDVRKNDRIILETVDGNYEYVVESTRIVGRKDVQVLAPSKESVLTLVTCYPFNYVGNAPRRFIVRARQVTDTVAESSSSPTTAHPGS